MDMRPVDRLVAAALLGRVTQVRRMVAADPALLSARNMFGAGAVHAAHYGGQDGVLAALGDLGLVMDGFLAAELGRVHELREVLVTDPGFAGRFDERGSTALHGAAYWGQHEAAGLLLDSGADPNAVSRDGFLRIPPLGSAVATTPGIAQPSDSEDAVLGLVRLLLERGADVNGRRGAAPGADSRGHRARPGPSSSCRATGCPGPASVQPVRVIPRPRRSTPVISARPSAVSGSCSASKAGAQN